MTYFHKCKTCKFDKDCVHKNNIKDALKGLGVTSCKHNCKHYESFFYAGEPLLITVYEWEEDTPYNVNDRVEETYHGNFIEWSKQGLKAVCFIAPGTPSYCDEATFLPRKDGKGFVRISIKNIKRNKDGTNYIPKQCIWCDAVFVDTCDCVQAKSKANNSVSGGTYGVIGDANE